MNKKAKTEALHKFKGVKNFEHRRKETGRKSTEEMIDNSNPGSSKRDFFKGLSREKHEGK